VPAKLGAGGIEEVIEVELTGEETAALQRSANSVRELIGVLASAA
jgi:malate dehydrogenase